MVEDVSSYSSLNQKISKFLFPKLATQPQSSSQTVAALSPPLTPPRRPLCHIVEYEPEFSASVNKRHNFYDIVCVGHPYMQYDATVKKEFLSKYEIKMGQSYIFPRDSPIQSDFNQYVTNTYEMGGEALRVAEAAQWTILFDRSAVFIGSVGSDFKDNLSLPLRHLSVSFKAESKPLHKSSVQLIVRYKQDWSEIYMFDQGASTLSMPFIHTNQIIKLLTDCRHIFVCMRSCLMTKMEVQQIAYFGCSMFKGVSTLLPEGLSLVGKEEAFKGIVKFIEYFFMSRKMAVTLMKEMEIPLQRHWCVYNRSRLIARSICMWLKDISKKSCKVIIFEGNKDVTIASDNAKMTGIVVKNYQSKFHSPSNIVDMYGTETAFVGGFLSHMVADKDNVKASVKRAFFCASAIATQHGAHFPLNRQQLLTQYNATKF